ncbi:hypothetical protein K470DRAFT_258386 [Piedraia hortae CBS 480.64]|uniref:MRG domain-containing protein n=1 Tax=Piedraia hortae CBS 480.64 TaxID=1314780 RepID=A0A6A7BXB7_9PEZI|nr:hypothetical protein K470DRAFT_258386 [Piedraia hortae CBS 480.64]
MRTAGLEQRSYNSSSRRSTRVRRPSAKLVECRDDFTFNIFHGLSERKRSLETVTTRSRKRSKTRPNEAPSQTEQATDIVMTDAPGYDTSGLEHPPPHDTAKDCQQSKAPGSFRKHRAVVNTAKTLGVPHTHTVSSSPKSKAQHPTTLFKMALANNARAPPFEIDIWPILPPTLQRYLPENYGGGRVTVSAFLAAFRAHMAAIQPPCKLARIERAISIVEQVFYIHFETEMLYTSVEKEMWIGYKQAHLNVFPIQVYRCAYLIRLFEILPRLAREGKVRLQEQDRSRLHEDLTLMCLWLASNQYECLL